MKTKTKLLIGACAASAMAALYGISVKTIDTVEEEEVYFQPLDIVKVRCLWEGINSNVEIKYTTLYTYSTLPYPPSPVVRTLDKRGNVLADYNLVLEGTTNVFLDPRYIGCNF